MPANDDRERPRRIVRAGRAWRSFEDSLETSLLPWVVLSAIAAIAWIVSYLIWGDAPPGG